MRASNTYQLSQAGEALIKHYEGYSAAPYKCPAKKLTIGWGHVILKSDNITGAISQEHAQRLFDRDTLRFENAVRHYVTAPITQGMFDALVSFAYNLGTGNLKISTLLKVVNRGDYGRAPAEFRKWIFANRVVLSGLKKRREAEATLFMTGRLFLK
jgi:lysozyme